MRFRLGVVTTDNVQLGHEQYVGRLSIPYLTRAGVVSIRFRAIGPDRPKYMSLPGDMPRLFNVEALHDPGDTIAVCEGEVDAMTVDGLCGVPTVGVAGVGAWRPVFARALKGYRKVLVIADGDPVNERSGKRAGETLLDRILDDVRDAIPIRLPEGTDSNSIVSEHGPSALRERLGLDG